MFTKWPKTYRILVSQISTKGKHYLSDAETEKLLKGNVTISEKMDGANTAIIKTDGHFKLQKRGSLIGEGEHEQFAYFKSWSQLNYNKLMQIPNDTILYGELMYAQHTIHYDMLPDYFLAFGWFDIKKQTFHHWDDLEELCDKIGLYTTSFIAQLSNVNKESLFDLIPDPSTYGHEPAEGLVVFNHKEQMRGKVVRAEFQKAMDKSGHWRNKKLITNQVSDICHCDKEHKK